MGREVEGSYLGKSGSAKERGRTMLGRGGGGRVDAGGAIPFPLSLGGGLVLLAGLGRDVPGGAGGGGTMLMRWGRKGA